MNCEKIGKCPFCQSSDTHLLKTKTAFGNPIPNHYHVACQSCAAFGPLKKTKERAIDCWKINASMRLWVIGEKSSNPENWDRIKHISLIICESKERAIEIAGHGINEPVTEVDMGSESGLYYAGLMNVPEGSILKNRIKSTKTP